MRKLSFILLLFTAINITKAQPPDQDTIKSDGIITISPDDLFRSSQRREPDYSKTIYPENDGLTYDQYVGETIAGYSPADGWRIDTLSGFHKQVYWNPYVALNDNDRFEKQSFEGDSDFFYYKDGKKYSGKITDTMTSQYTREEIVFEATCVNGMLQGRGTLRNLKTKQVIARCRFKDGVLIE